jgi:hypothetical protein
VCGEAHSHRVGANELPVFGGAYTAENLVIVAANSLVGSQFGEHNKQ